MPSARDNLIWIDLEMTGLAPESDRIIEIATVVTDPQLNAIAEGPALAIFQPESVLKAMDQWNQEHHAKSGLLERVRASDYSAADAEALTLDFLQRHAPAGHSPMCGSGICQDRRFLHRLMPRLEGYFHYRNLDVSTVKELVRRWDAGAAPYAKESSHRALDDIRDSIEELRHYRKLYFTC